MEMLSRFVCELQSWDVWGWILCRRLELGWGTVSSRVALLLQSAEVKPFVLQICLALYGWMSLSLSFSFKPTTWGQVQIRLESESVILFRAGLCMQFVKIKRKPQHPGFPHGPPPWYKLGSTLVNCTDQTGCSAFRVLWPWITHFVRNDLCPYLTLLLQLIFLLLRELIYIDYH